MKFLCGNCKAKYQIADEKVSGRTLRMKCRRCDHDILIDGHSMPTSSPPGGSGTGAARRANVSLAPGRAGSGAHPMPPRALGGLPSPVHRAPGRSTKPPSGLSADFRRHVAAPPEVPQRTAPYDLWHVAIQDVPVGPMSRDELARKVDSGAVTASSLCWREGMDDWRPLGELPELAALLRRPRDGRSVRPPPPRPRAPTLSPQGPRASAFPVDLEEYDDEVSEPTRIADLTGPQPSMPAPVARASGQSSPRLVPVGAPSMQAPAPAPSPAATATVSVPVVEHAPVAPVERPVKSGGNSGLTTGIAVGLLVGILLVGGPMLYRNTWGSAAVAPTPQPQAVVEQPKPADLAARDIAVELPEEVEAPKPAEEEVAKPETKTPTATRPATAKADTKTQSNGAKDNLTEEERKLLERMGGGGGAIANLNKPKTTSGGGGGGPSLTAAQLMSVVQNNKAALQRCYETALRAAGGQQQDTIKVTVNVVVGESGIVKSVTTQGPGLGNMNDCLKTSVKRWKFPTSGGESEFAFPLVFQPGA